jgi:hypothetical protein
VRIDQGHRPAEVVRNGPRLRGWLEVAFEWDAIVAFIEFTGACPSTLAAAELRESHEVTRVERSRLKVGLQAYGDLEWPRLR